MSSAESRFLISMDNKEQYRDEWVAILGSKVIAHGKDVGKVYEEATKMSKGKTPLFTVITDKNKEQTLIL